MRNYMENMIGRVDGKLCNYSSFNAHFGLERYVSVMHKF